MKATKRSSRIFLAVVTFALAIYSGINCVRHLFVDAFGIVSDGTAVSVDYRRGKGGGYFVDYNFAYKDATYHGRSRVDSDWANGRRTPTPIHVRFFPAYPDFNSPADIGRCTPLWLGILFALLFSYVTIKIALDLRAASVKQDSEPDA